MKQFNDITIIGIDQGYGNMKTANTIFPTAITAYDTAPMFKGDVLEYGGRFYRVGEDHKGFVADKSEDSDFYLLTLAAIAKELEQYRLFTANLCLAVGLPLSWVGSQRESFRQYLMQKSRMFTAPLNSRTFPKAITKNSDKRPAAAFFTKAAAVVRMSILRIFRPSCRQNRRCRYSTRWNCCRP